jgi:hypothetical protein
MFELGDIGGQIAARKAKPSEIFIRNSIRPE